MKLLEERILSDGLVGENGILRVDSFLNHSIDCELLSQLAREWKKLFSSEKITKILTIEASGIAPAVAAGIEFGVPVVYAKRTTTRPRSSDIYFSRVVSFTHGSYYVATVNKDYLTKDDSVLIIDDFLANGSAMHAMIDIVRQAGANLVGAGIAIEKTYLKGGEAARALGCRVESLARIKRMTTDGIIEFI